MFAPFGKITSRKIMNNKDEEGNDAPKGFGFVAFETNESAVKAVEALDGKVCAQPTTIATTAAVAHTHSCYPACRS